MPGNSFGRVFVLTTYGESHGPAYGCIVDGCPAGLALSEADIQSALDRRRPGQSRYTSRRRETDTVQILSGVFEGKTTGTPIALQIANTDQRSRDYDQLADCFRPGHGDYTYHHKYQHRDHRGGGRASARETLLRVAAGAIAQKYCAERYGISVRGCLIQLGPIGAEKIDWQAVNDNPFFFPCAAQVPALEAYVDKLRRDGDSIGAKVLVEAHGVPVGLGEPVYDKLDARIASAMMGINAVKGVAIGDGFEVVTQRGSEHRDELNQTGFLSNHAGGTLAGISTGQPVRVSLALKPTSSIRLPAKTLDTAGNETEVSTHGRHDPCVGIRAVPVAEAMLALVLMDFLLLQRGGQDHGVTGEVLTEEAK